VLFNHFSFNFASQICETLGSDEEDIVAEARGQFLVNSRGSKYCAVLGAHVSIKNDLSERFVESYRQRHRTRVSPPSAGKFMGSIKSLGFHGSRMGLKRAAASSKVFTQQFSFHFIDASIDTHYYSIDNFHLEPTASFFIVDDKKAREQINLLASSA
jgi:hypothetical protein